MFLETSVLLGIHLAGFALWTGFLIGFLLLGTSAIRLLRACVVVMPMTLLSGWALAFVQFGAPGSWFWAVNAMQTAGLAMAVVLLVAVFGALMLLRDAEATRDPEAVATATRRLTRLVGVDIGLAVLILGFALAGRYG